MDASVSTPGLGSGHHLAQTDVVGGTLLLALIAMSIAPWVLVALNACAYAYPHRRGQAFLALLWNGGTVDPVRHELQTHGAHDPFSHLAAHAPQDPAHHARHGAARLADAARAEVTRIGFVSEPEQP